MEPALSVETAESMLTRPASPIEVYPFQTDESEQNRLGIRWNEFMGSSSRPVKHDKTVVLIISWDPECSDMDTTEEVDDLAKVFKEVYNFEVQQRRLEGKKNLPQIEFQGHLATFLLENDDPHALLIIYYAGHGWSDDQGNRFTLAKNHAESKGRAEAKMEREHVQWNMAESLIRLTKSDVLLIFDCCHAGVLCRRRSSLLLDGLEPRRVFEYLAACDAQSTTAKPGRTSFTSALIWALQKLATKNHFSSSELLQKIMEAPDFPKDQWPQLFHRFEPTQEHISISSLSPKEGSTQTARYREDYDREWLDLRLQFIKPLDDEVMHETARKLKCLLMNDKEDLCVERILFLKKVSRLQTVQTAVRHWRRRSLRRRAESSGQHASTILISPCSDNSDLEAGVSRAQVPSLVISPVTCTTTVDDDGETAVEADETRQLLPKAGPTLSKPNTSDGISYNIKMSITYGCKAFIALFQVLRVKTRCCISRNKSIGKTNHR